MAIFMVFALALSALFVIAGHLLERLCAVAGWPNRIAWIAVISLASTVPALAMLNVDRGPSRETVAGSSLATSIPIAHSADIIRIDAPARFVDSLANNLAFLDAGLILLWIGASLLLALGLATLVIRSRLLIRGAIRHPVGDTETLITRDTGPALAGIWSYTIVLPGWTLSLRPEQRALIMMHEQQHARSRDPLLIWTGALLVALFPWNVGLWYSMFRLRAAIEIDCDRRVLLHTPDLHGYASLLIDVAERTSRSFEFAAAFSESPSLLARRITAMSLPACERPALQAALFGAGAVLVLTAAACVPQPQVRLDEIRHRSATFSPSPGMKVQSASDLAMAGSLADDTTKLKRNPSKAIPSLDSAKILARHLEPSAFDSIRVPTSTVVGLIFGEGGTVVHHSSIAVPNGTEALRPLYGRLFPDARRADRAVPSVMALIDGEYDGGRTVQLVAIYLTKSSK